VRQEAVRLAEVAIRFGSLTGITLETGLPCSTMNASRREMFWKRPQPARWLLR
jgi:hypothetical protein